MFRFCLHGFTGSPRSFDRLPRGASESGRLCPSLLGHGSLTDSATFVDEVDRLAGLVPTGEPVHLIGYSMGARLGVVLLARHPTLFGCATLIAPHPGLASRHDRQARMASDGRWIALLRERGLEEFISVWEALPMWRTQSDASPRLLSKQQAIRLGHTADGLIRALRVLGLGAMPDVRAALERVVAPVQLVVGEQDPKFRALADQLQPHLSGSIVVPIPDCGHNPLVEAPTALSTCVNDFEATHES